MTKMLKAIEVALPTSYLHPITSQAHSYPYTTLNFSVSQIHVNAFGILGKQCKKKKFDAFKGRWKDNNAISHLYCFSLCFCVRLPVT